MFGMSKREQREERTWQVYVGLACEEHRQHILEMERQDAAAAGGLAQLEISKLRRQHETLLRLLISDAKRIVECFEEEERGLKRAWRCRRP